jgi:nanoRNase/pAp phosphatase (c-di-AMP/oligoRNAs hydrolase)
MRLVTRSDFDGLVCAVLLKQVEQIDSIQFVHPKDLQDGTFVVSDDDILANVPYVPGCGIWFDHHSSELERVVGTVAFKGACRLAPSAARVIYDYYGGEGQFGRIDTMMAEVDKADSAQFTRDEILHPRGWPLLSFLMDARTGLGRYKDYEISNYQLMYNLISACAYMSIEQILRLPDVQERITRYFEQNELYQAMVQERSTVYDGVIVTDLRDADPIYSGNRFLVYALYPEQHTSVWIVDGLQKKNCVFACGHSILNKRAPSKIGALMRRFGGGGHDAAGTCQVPYDVAEETLKLLIATMNDPGVEYQKAA